MSRYRDLGYAVPTGVPCHRSYDGPYAAALRSESEVAAILGITQQAVHQAERRAFLKIRLRMASYWREYNGR